MRSEILRPGRSERGGSDQRPVPTPGGGCRATGAVQRLGEPRNVRAAAQVSRAVRGVAQPTRPPDPRVAPRHVPERPRHDCPRDGVRWRRQAGAGSRQQRPAGLLQDRTVIRWPITRPNCDQLAYYKTEL